MKNKLKLYVWEGALTDYSDGIIFALSKNLVEAKKLILKDCVDYGLKRVKQELKKKPKVYDNSVAYHLWGGG